MLDRIRKRSKAQDTIRGVYARDYKGETDNLFRQIFQPAGTEIFFGAKTGVRFGTRSHKRYLKRLLFCDFPLSLCVERFIYRGVLVNI